MIWGAAFKETPKQKSLTQWQAAGDREDQETKTTYTMQQPTLTRDRPGSSLGQKTGHKDSCFQAEKPYIGGASNGCKSQLLPEPKEQIGKPFQSQGPLSHSLGQQSGVAFPGKPGPQESPHLAET